MGMFLGLFVREQVGIFGVCWLLIQCYSQAARGQFIGKVLRGTVLCGVEFTISLFIASLAFGQGGDVFNGAANAILLA